MLNARLCGLKNDRIMATIARRYERFGAARSLYLITSLAQPVPTKSALVNSMQPQVVESLYLNFVPGSPRMSGGSVMAPNPLETPNETAAFGVGRS
jgi:hypothetical protein